MTNDERMTKRSPVLFAIAVLVASALRASGGTLSYVPIPATQSDANCGISSADKYTTAVDGGNAGAGRVINGITLYPLAGTGASLTSDNCTLTALAGGLVNGGGTPANIQADGMLRQVMSDMTFNSSATDNSQQEIVLDPDTLEAGITYDLRVYICNAAGQDRQVNLAFEGDGQNPAETGFFNEDDARTSAGGFTDANQVYYINYRYTWDGESTPGITITQKTGAVPFCLYALTNQIVPSADAAAETGDEGLSVGLVNAESDEVGVASDDFYSSESLNSNGRWIELEKWGKCWQPNNVASGWAPYTNGSWRHCDDCGWTFVSDEPWAWACYHYGRWTKVRTGCGWAWVPGKVWAGSWVSWRQGRDESCSCIGWAPLPPEASCNLNVGVGTWVDRTCDIGPEYYTFVNVRDFASDSYFGCGCIYERPRNITIIIDTINITNIFFNRRTTYCGGPDFQWCNERIRRFGGKEVTKIHVHRLDDPTKIKGGKFSHLEGNQLALLSPRVKGEKNPKHVPKAAEHIGADKIDKGWSDIKDKKLEKQLRNKIAQESKGKTPKTAKATLPPDVADQINKHHGGKGNKGATMETAAAGGQPPFDQHPGGKGKNKESASGVNAGPSAVNRHPGGKGRKHVGEAANTNAGAVQNAQGGGHHRQQQFNQQQQFQQLQQQQQLQLQQQQQEQQQQRGRKKKGKPTPIPQ